MPRHPNTVDEFLEIGCGRCEKGSTPECKVLSWQPELKLLRAIVLESGLTEEIKWMSPCYTTDGKNVVMVSAFNDCAVLSFHQGEMMTDPDNILQLPGKNSRYGRIIKFTDVKAIKAQKKTLLAYLAEAIEIRTSGKKMVIASDEPDLPEELIQAFEENRGFEEAWSALTPGRRRGYVLHFNSAKQSKTKVSRIEKCQPKIFAGKGWNEY